MQALNAGQTLTDTITVRSLDGTTSTVAVTINGTNEAPTVTTINGTAAANTLNGTSGDDIINGLGGRDTLNGGDGNDRLDGGTDRDAMNGGAGNDTYVVDNSRDTLTDTSGIDTVESFLTSFTLATNFENLTFVGTGAFTGTGNGAANVIKGGAGADTLNGAGGNDTLIGGLGVDRLTGGTGADTFVFSKAGPADNMRDFSHADDTLAFLASEYGLAAGALDASRFQNSSSATLGQAEFFYNSANRTLYYDADGVAGGSVAVATFATAVTLDATDFVII